MQTGIFTALSNAYKDYLVNPAFENVLEPLLTRLFKSIIQSVTENLTSPREKMIGDVNVRPSSLLEEVINTLNLFITDDENIQDEDLKQIAENLGIILRNSNFFSLNNEKIEGINKLIEILNAPKTDQTTDNLQEYIKILNDIYLDYKNNTSNNQKKSDAINSLFNAATNQLLGKKDDSIDRLVVMADNLIQNLQNNSPSSAQKDIKEIIHHINYFKEAINKNDNPYELTNRQKRITCQNLDFFEELLTVHSLQSENKEINLNQFKLLKNKTNEIPSVDVIKENIIELIKVLKNDISSIQHALNKEAFIPQLTEQAVNAISSTLHNTASRSPIAALAEKGLTYLANPEQEKKGSSYLNQNFQLFDLNLTEKDNQPIAQNHNASTILFPLFQYFLQPSSDERFDIFQGLSAIIGRKALDLLNSMIQHMKVTSQDGDNSNAQRTLSDVKTIIQAALNNHDQSFHAYSQAFTNAWNLCTKHPILIGGFELPVGLNTANSNENPVKTAQQMAAKFSENHLYLNNRNILPEQTDERIERLAQTGTCFGTYRFCALALGSPADFPTFEAIISQTKTLDKNAREKFFLQKVKESVDANTSANIIVRWFTSLFIPLTYWFSKLFSQNLSKGLKTYFRNIVIPNIKKDDDKRLYSGSIEGIGRSLDDLNKIMTETNFIENKGDCGWEVRDHIRKVKDAKIYNGGRTADELYNDFADICADEIMPKLSWTAEINKWSSSLVEWAQNSDSSSIKILKYIGIIPLQIFVWITQYLMVAPIQSISQAILTWGAKKAFVETKVIRNIMENIKTTQFRDTPYVPVLDFLAQRLLAIHEAQINNISPDTGSYKSDEENRQKIKAFLDRAFRFIRIWDTNSREEIKAIMTNPSGFSGEIQNVIKGALNPLIQNTLVDLIEIVQSLATEESQLESFLFQICEIADESLCNQGKSLTSREKKKRGDQYNEIQKLIESTLNAILWTVSIESTSEIGRSGTVKVAKDHITWIKKVFLGESQTSSTNSSQIPERGSLDLDDDDDDDDDSISSTESFTNSLDFNMENNSKVNETDTRIGHINYWLKALNLFLENPNQNSSYLKEAYHNCCNLVKVLEEKEVEINAQQIAGAVTRQHLETRSNSVLNSLKTVYDQFHHLHNLYLYYEYTKTNNDENSYPINNAIECIDLLESIKDKMPDLELNHNNNSTHEDVNNYLISLNEKEETLFSSSDIPLELSILKTEINGIRTHFNSDFLDKEKHIIHERLNKIISKKAHILNQIKESKEIFNNKNALQQETSKMRNSLTNLKKVVDEISYIEFLEIDFPTPLKAMGHLSASVIQQTLFQAMSSRSKILINAICNAEVFEMFIRNIAIRPLVESLRGEKRNS